MLHIRSDGRVEWAESCAQSLQANSHITVYNIDKTEYSYTLNIDIRLYLKLTSKLQNCMIQTNTKNTNTHATGFQWLFQSQILWCNNVFNKWFMPTKYISNLILNKMRIKDVFVLPIIDCVQLVSNIFSLSTEKSDAHL